MHNNSLCAHEMKIEFSLHISVEDLIETHTHVKHKRICFILEKFVGS